MFYSFYRPILLIQQQPFDVIAFWSLLFAGGSFVIGLLNLRGIIALNRAEIFLKPYKVFDKKSNKEFWEFRVTNASNRLVYVNLKESWFEEEENNSLFNLKSSRDEELLLPMGDDNSCRIKVPEAQRLASSNNTPTFHLHIKFKDTLGKTSVSHHAGWFQEDEWVIQNLKNNSRYKK